MSEAQYNLNTKTTNRTDFNETWLSEMPSGLGSIETFNMLEYNIKERIKHGSAVHSISNDIYKIVGQQTIYYWYQYSDEIILGSELSVRPQGLVVSITGKNPKWTGKHPYASELYNAILDDNNRSIRLLSDTQLSDEGYNIWKRLFQMGHNVSVYDKESPGNSFKTFQSQEEMDNYFSNDDTNFSRYQFVLSESGEMLAETSSFFNTRRYRELSGLTLTD